MLIHLVRVTHGMIREELGNCLEASWVHTGRQAVRMGDLIVDLIQPVPPNGIVDVGRLDTAGVDDASPRAAPPGPIQCSRWWRGRRYWKPTSVTISTRPASVCSSSNGLWAYC